MPSRFLTTQTLRPALLIAALASIGAACGGTPEGQGDEQGEDTGAPPKGYAPGYAVDCLPESKSDPLVCIVQANWDCPVRGHYFREAMCADALGGTPAGYDGKPELVKVDPDGVGPEEPTTAIYCDNLPEGVVASQLDVAPCNDCNVCTLQLDGYFDWGFKQGYGWDEFPWCPDSFDAIAEQICSDDGTMDPPTTGADDEAGMGGSGIWKCMGSWTISGTMHETSPPQSSTEIFMSPKGVPDCVNATDELDAEATCSSLCQTKNEIYNQEAQNSPSKNWEPFNCVELDNFTPVEAIDPSECAGGGPMALTDPAPFTANATLKIGGTNTTSDQLGGLMEFTIEACPKTRRLCDVSITEIRTNARTVNGVHTNLSGAAVSFSIADLEVRMLQPVLGQWERASGVVTFPGKDLFATISTGVITLDGEPMSSGLDHALFEVDDATGTWDGRQLALDLPWRKDGLSLSLQITAR